MMEALSLSLKHYGVKCRKTASFHLVYSLYDYVADRDELSTLKKMHLLYPSILVQVVLRRYFRAGAETHRPFSKGESDHLI